MVNGGWSTVNGQLSVVHSPSSVHRSFNFYHPLFHHSSGVLHVSFTPFCSSDELGQAVAFVSIRVLSGRERWVLQGKSKFQPALSVVFKYIHILYHRIRWKKLEVAG